MGEVTARRVRAATNEPGLDKPDFVFRSHRLAVFVDGCFWHGCPLHATSPKTNADFWLKKLAANRTRDRLVSRTLRALGWRVLRIWEHELKRANEPRLLARLNRALAQINVLTSTLTKHPVSPRLPALFVRHLGDPWSINSRVESDQVPATFRA